MCQTRGQPVLLSRISNLTRDLKVPSYQTQGISTHDGVDGCCGHGGVRLQVGPFSGTSCRWGDTLGWRRVSWSLSWVGWHCGGSHLVYEGLQELEALQVSLLTVLIIEVTQDLSDELEATVLLLCSIPWVYLQTAADAKKMFNGEAADPLRHSPQDSDQLLHASNRLPERVESEATSTTCAQ